MPINDVLLLALTAGFIAIMVWCAVSDIRDRRIPNVAVLALLALFVPWTLLQLGANFLSGIAAAAIALVVTVILYIFKIVGAGDAKLFASASLFVGLAQLPHLALATVLAGGVIALISLVTRPRRGLVMVMMKGRGDYGRGIPYGVAIAAGSIIVLCRGIAGAASVLAV